MSIVAQSSTSILEPTSHRRPVLASDDVARPAPEDPIGRIPVTNVQPVLEAGRWPAKAVPGEVIPINANVFREGHDAVAATAVLYGPDGTVKQRSPMYDISPGNDYFEGFLQADAEGDWTFAVEAWSDPYGTWAHDASVKFAAGVDQLLMLEEGKLLFDRIMKLDGGAVRSRRATQALKDAAMKLADETSSWDARLAAALSPAVREALAEQPLRDLVSSSPRYPLRVSRRLALYGSWYEMFPRSEGAWQDHDGKWHSGTFQTAAHRLPEIARMGFDVVYLIPIHPIGTTFRKGRNNTLVANEGDPGSPYAIGSPDGGHDAIHPDLGTEADFVDFVNGAKQFGMEVALDLALQCSPDHPWVTQHPEWFKIRADGTIAYAENPPKKYQDIYPLYFDLDPIGLREAIYDVVMHWVKLGVTCFRVDNPHTKPLDFWQWLLAKVYETNPEIIFLSEAFTKPAMMQTLARIGFQQSYTYFTWRNSKEDIEKYFAEVSGMQGSNMRPSFWPTTHDILPPYLQHGGVAGFAVRAVLAAMGAPTWGIYSGYELIENVPRPGVEEQIDNEKYEYKPRNWDAANNIGIKSLLTRLNTIRRAHPALQQLRNLTIHQTENENIIAFSRRIPAGKMPLAADPEWPTTTPPGTDDVILVVVNLDPWGTQETYLHLDMAALGLVQPDGTTHDPYAARDLITGQTYLWNASPFIRLDPRGNVAHILHITP